MARSDYEYLKIQELRTQLEVAKERAQQCRSVHAEQRHFGDLDDSNDSVMRGFYESNYRTLLNLSGQYERELELLEELKYWERKLESKEEHERGFKLGLIIGALIGAAVLCPLIRLF